MPWTCLPGEPSDVNWCNDPSGWDLYKNPPQAWRGANDHGKPQVIIQQALNGRDRLMWGALPLLREHTPIE